MMTVQAQRPESSASLKDRVAALPAKTQFPSSARTHMARIRRRIAAEVGTKLFLLGAF